jgi:hypothetical protein
MKKLIIIVCLLLVASILPSFKVNAAQDIVQIFNNTSEYRSGKKVLRTIDSNTSPLKITSAGCSITAVTGLLTSSETWVVGTSAKTGFPTLGSAVWGFYIVGIAITTSNAINSGSMTITDGPLEATKVLIWQQAGTSNFYNLTPFPMTISGTSAITVSTGVAAYIQYVDY